MYFNGILFAEYTMFTWGMKMKLLEFERLSPNYRRSRQDNLDICPQVFERHVVLDWNVHVHKPRSFQSDAFIDVDRRLVFTRGTERILGGDPMPIYGTSGCAIVEIR